MRQLLALAALSAVACRAPVAHPIVAPPPAPAPPVAAPLAAPLAATIDDFERPAPPGAWFSYSDGTAGGALHRTIEPTEGGHHALHVTAEGWRDWGAGVGVQLGRLTPARAAREVDASAYEGIRFRARGRGNLRVNVTTSPLISVADGGACDLGRACFDWPGADVHLGAEWATVELPFCALAPVGWGRASAKVDPKQLVAVHFRLPENEAHDLWLEDLAFIPASRADAGASARCGPACPVTAAPPGAILAPARLSPAHAAAGLTVHTFEQPTRSCGPLTRRYLAYVPSRLPARSAAPVLIALHGWGSNAENFRDFQTHGAFERLADRDGFIVVYANAAPGPATSVRVPNSGAWRQPVSEADEVDDVAYLDAVLEDLHRRDVVGGGNAVFLVGHSNGGGMVIQAARLRPDRYTGFAALMPYAGLAPRAPASLDGARLSRVLFVYSLTDPGLPANYAAGTLGPLVDGWAAALGLAPATIAGATRTPLPDRVHEGESYAGSLRVALATRDSHGEQLDLRPPAAPARAAAVRVLVFDHAGHMLPHPVQDVVPFVLEQWGLRNQDLDAAEAVWSFFRDAGARP